MKIDIDDLRGRVPRAYSKNIVEEYF